MLSSQKMKMLAAKRSKRKCISKYSSSSILEDVTQNQVHHGSSLCLGLEYLTSDCLEYIALFLDSQSALGRFKYSGFLDFKSYFSALYRSCKSIRAKLKCCVHFWKHLCKNENFDEYFAIKKDGADFVDGKERLTWSGEKFHDLEIPADANYWNRVFLRGMEMRRNVYRGKFELWRLYMTDKVN